MILVAGIGNVFFGDDGFGVAVARALAASPPPGSRVVDFGIRAMHLAYELLEPHELLVAVDCVARGGVPGTLYVIEPDPSDSVAPVASAHGMDLTSVLSIVVTLGGRPPPMLIVGCEPGSLTPRLGLSAPVERALDDALALVRDVVAARVTARDHHDQEHTS